MDIVMVFQSLKEFTHFGALGIGKLRKLLGEITGFARHNGPTFFCQSLRDSVSGGSIRNESRPGRTFRYAVVFPVEKRFHFVGARFDRRSLRVDVVCGMISLDQTDMI